LKELIEDIYRFVLKNGTMIQMAPLQAYVSALLFTPTESLTRRMFANEQPRWIPKKPIVDQKWGSAIHSIDVGRVVHWLTFSHDSKLLASQSFSRIQIWDVSTGLIRAELEMILGWDYPTCSIIFSYDSSLLASASARGHIVIWDVATGARKHTIQTTETIETIASFEAIMATGQMKKLTFSRDSNLLGVCCNRYSEIWETKTWSLRKTIPHKMHGGFGWRRLPPAYFSPDMELLIPPPSGGKIELWDTATCSPRQMFQLEDPVSMIVFSHDAKLLAAGSESGTIYIWNIASSSLERTIRGHVSEAVFLQFSQDSQTFISASKDGLMKVWNAINWSVIPAIDGQTSRRFNPGLNLMSVSNDSKLLALGSNITVQSIQIWDMERFSQEHRASEPSQRACQPIFSEDLKRSSSVSASGDLTITVGSTSSGAVEKQLKLGDHTNRLVGWSHDMRFFAWTADDGTTNIGELSSGEIKQILRHPGPRTECVTFSFDGNYLALVGHDKRGPVTIWSMATGQLLLSTANEIQRENGLAFSHDSRFLAVACASDIKIWDIEKAPRTQPVKQAGTDHHRTIFCLAFSHDSGLLAEAKYYAHKSSPSIDIWSTSTMTLIKTITMEKFIPSLSFNSDDTFLITGGSCVAIRSSPSDPISTGEDLVAKAKYLGYYFRGSWIELHGKKMVYIPGDYRKIGLRASHFIAESQSTHFQPVTRMASRSLSGRSWLMELVETEASYV
jgi:WD40 repeat protein